MKYQYLRAFIVLVAGLITLIANIRTHKDVTDSLLILIGVIIVFYIIGTLAVEILQRSMKQTEEHSDEGEEEASEYAEDTDGIGNSFEEEE